MPLYEYCCPTHGSFDEFRPSSHSSAPIACPICGEQATRVLTVPRMRQMDKGRLIGMERNEKSRHEPHVCKTGCGCSSGKARKQDKLPNGQPKPQVYKGPRPWVVEHA
ncbi:zinc ribbon domain-containing protein [Algisphaera agarilytica]|uniref:Putative FmdB family regulatory protein n=1 Tax=Algisphaera agarilytica TaxID=1385975 RepID=A0A7X0LLC4_9BACT|nr:zinc ribbon domain-containing protein [Algisphaera agarilytica]MBB6431355.1 putative FmdB family regulatory protein [Algisphaera agarilytica]